MVHINYPNYYVVRYLHKWISLTPNYYIFRCVSNIARYGPNLNACARAHRANTNIKQQQTLQYQSFWYEFHKLVAMTPSIYHIQNLVNSYTYEYMQILFTRTEAQSISRAHTLRTEAEKRRVFRWSLEKGLNHVVAMAGVPANVLVQMAIKFILCILHIYRCACTVHTTIKVKQFAISFVRNFWREKVFTRKKINKWKKETQNHLRD